MQTYHKLGPSQPDVPSANQEKVTGPVDPGNDLAAGWYFSIGWFKILRLQRTSCYFQTYATSRT